jgi:tetratricopeptide (TPR) repeat protein
MLADSAMEKPATSTPGIRADKQALIPPTLDGASLQAAQGQAAVDQLAVACVESADAAPVPDLAVVLAAARLAARAHPDYADLQYFAAQAATRSGQLREAHDLLARALNLNPQYNDALILAARVAMTQGQQAEAIAFLRRALVNGADYADVHVMLGDLWRRRDEFVLAQQAYHRALDLNAGLTAARQGLAALAAFSQRGGANELPA